MLASSAKSSSENKKIISRPWTTAPVFSRPICDRVKQLSHVPTQRYKMVPHLRSQRSKSAHFSQNYLPKTERVTEGKGYVLNKTNNSYNMQIDTDQFFSKSSSVFLKPETPVRDSLIADLQQQISYLTLILEEEKMIHHRTLLKTSEIWKQKLETMQKDHEKKIVLLENSNHESLENLRKNLHNEFDTYKTSTEAHILRLSEEKAVLQNTFHSYKLHLTSETEQNWVKREASLKEVHQQETAIAVAKAREEADKEVERVKGEYGEKLRCEIGNMKAVHSAELDDVNTKFTDCLKDAADVAEERDKLQGTTQKLEQMMIDKTHIQNLLEKATAQISHMKTELAVYKDKYHQKTENNTGKFQTLMDELRMQNTELRRKYVDKCQEVYHEKCTMENNRINAVTTAQATLQRLIKIRQRSAVSLISNTNGVQPKSRRSSHPVTEREQINAIKLAGHVSISGVADYISSYEI